MTKPGPNDPCPCGSGRKFKKCCREVADVLISAAAHHQRGEIEPAAELYGRVLQADAGHAGALYALGVIACQTRRFRQALEFLSRAAERNPNSAIVHHSLGTALQAEQRWEESANAFARAIALQPDYAASVLCLGATLHALGRTGDAADCFTRAIQLVPENAEAHNNLGAMQHDLGQLNAAEANFRRALQLNPGYAEAFNNLGGVLRLLGQHEEAVEPLLKSLSLRWDNAGAHYNLGMVYRALNRTEDAIASLAEAIRIQPDNQHAEYFLHALKGDVTPPATPPQLVANLFDGYAERFDQHLQGALHYQTPAELRQAFAGTGASGPLDILDLGCGTGLSGLAFRDLASRLHGVDISSRMVAKARQRAIYDELYTTELLPALQREPRCYDLILAADVFVYTGDLDSIFNACRSALKANGWFLFSAESAEGESYRLSSSGRFQHPPNYIRALTALHGFTEIFTRHVPLRHERGEPVEGCIYLLRLN